MWHIAVPAWGDRCIDLAVNVAVPSILAGLEHVSGPAKFVVHTDRPSAFPSALFGEHLSSVIPLNPPLPNAHAQLSQCHREVIAGAAEGDFVAPLNADHAVSFEAFAACEARFAEGVKLIMCGSPRCLHSDVVPAAGAAAADLAEYALDHLHPIVLDSVWPDGSTIWPSVNFFRAGRNFVLRAFHLHPFAIVARPGLEFKGTIDRDLVDCFSEEETHVVTDPDELALLEFSPLDKSFALADYTNTIASVVEWARRKASPRHQWFFNHKIVLAGDGDLVDDSAADEIARRLAM